MIGQGRGDLNRGPTVGVSLQSCPQHVVSMLVPRPLAINDGACGHQGYPVSLSALECLK